MAQWFRVMITKNQVADGELMKLRREFEDFFMGAQCPKGAVLFRHKLKNGNVEVYFSPVASECAKALVQQYSGTGCSRPSRNVFLLFGDAKELL